MGLFEKGNNGRPKGAKNKLTNDVRAIFHKVYEEMGGEDKDGKKVSGHQAMLTWARDNQTEFYRLYGKMIPATAELVGDVHENFLDMLVIEDEVKLIEANVVDVGNDGPIEGTNGEKSPDNAPHGDDAPDKDADLV